MNVDDSIGLNESSDAAAAAAAGDDDNTTTLAYLSFLESEYGLD